MAYLECDEAAVRTQYNTLQRQLHASVTVNGYRNVQLSSQRLVAENVRLSKIVWKKEFVCFKQTGVGLRSSGRTGIVLLVNDR